MEVDNNGNRDDSGDEDGGENRRNEFSIFENVNDYFNYNDQ